MRGFRLLLLFGDVESVPLLAAAEEEEEAALAWRVDVVEMKRREEFEEFEE